MVYGNYRLTIKKTGEWFHASSFKVSISKSGKSGQIEIGFNEYRRRIYNLTDVRLDGNTWKKNKDGKFIYKNIFD